MKPKGVIHWVSAEHSVPATPNMTDYSALQIPLAPTNDVSANPDSIVSDDAMIEPALRDAAPETGFSSRRGTCADRYDTAPLTCVL